MEQLDLLASAIGISALAGINLYLTVFLISGALYFNLLSLHESMATLDILGHPVVLIVAGVLFAIEFTADKVPWVDSLWDSIHTFIRPIGGALLGLSVIGQTNPLTTIIIALVCGGTALSTHATKSTSRVLVNSTPIPFTNVVASIINDIAVVLGMALTLVSPVLMLILVVIFLLISFYAAPKILRFTLMTFRFLFFKITSIGMPEKSSVSLPRILPFAVQSQLNKEKGKEDYIAWAVEVITGSNKGVPRHRFATLCYLLPSNRLGLIVRKHPIVWLKGPYIRNKLRWHFLFDEIRFYEQHNEKKSMTVRLAKHQSALGKTVIADLDKRASQA
ncbi:MAG: DUF4126 domain-containing protein [Verrucomicrobiota bacterium]